MALPNGRSNNRAGSFIAQRSVIRRAVAGFRTRLQQSPGAAIVLPRVSCPNARGRGAYMRRGLLLVAMLSAVATMACADNSKPADKDKNKPEPAVAQYFKNDDTGTDSSVSVEGSSVSYHAVAGTN